jgi:hypothetical protein
VQRSLPIVSLAAAVLVLAAPAAEAKELTSFKACGAGGCKEIKSPALLRRLIRGVEAQGEPVTTRTPAPASFFRLEFTAKGDEGSTPSFTQYYTRPPALVAMETNPGAWTWVKAGALRSLIDRVTAGVTPFAAPTIASVKVGGKAVADPASYTRLFSLDALTNDYPDNGDWTTIRLETADPSPWSTGAATLEYSPGKNVLWRGAEFVKVPPALASRLEARSSLGRPALTGAVGGVGSFPWLAVLVGIAGTALVLPAAVHFHRRRGR